MKKAGGQNQGGREIAISLSPEIEKGVYCNLAAISHSNREFILDFIFQVQKRGHVVARVITNPAHAKAIAAALNDNIAKYEHQFGEVESGGEVPPTPVIRH